MGTQPRFVVLFDEASYTTVRGQKALKRLTDSIIAGDESDAMVYEGVLGENLIFVREVSSEA